MESVVDSSGEEYEEISDLLNRHITLKDANYDLKTQVNVAEVEVGEN